MLTMNQLKFKLRTQFLEKIIQQPGHKASMCTTDFNLWYHMGPQMSLSKVLEPHKDFLGVALDASGTSMVVSQIPCFT